VSVEAGIYGVVGREERRRGGVAWLTAPLMWSTLKVTSSNRSQE
jgi:hypothetical protein